MGMTCIGQVLYKVYCTGVSLSANASISTGRNCVLSPWATVLLISTCTCDYMYKITP